MGLHTLDTMNRLAALLALLLATLAPAETRRIAIIVGNNAGSGDMPPLRYAESDAGKMARVMVELGEVPQDDILLLQGRTERELEQALTDAKERVQMYSRAPDVRTVLIFYFSGHSDGEGLEMGRDSLPFARLKAMMAGIGADVRVAIVDACRSGAGIKEKGARPAEAFTIKLADTLQTSGEVFITSSASNEAALESSEVAGSLFTHNLISGLRGAADASGDRLVTLSEAYRYAYDRTVSATSVLPVGAQHPNFDFRLSGQGELVLSSLQRPTSLMVLPEGADRTLVTDLARDQVVVEVPAGPAREVALSPGLYGLRLFRGGSSFGGKIQLQEGQKRVVRWDELVAMSSSITVARKGGGGSVEREIEPPARESSVGVGVTLGATSRLVPLAYDVNNPLMPKGQLAVWVEPFSAKLGSTPAFGVTSLGTMTFRAELAFMGAAEFSAGETSATAPNEVGAQARLVPRLRLDWGVLELFAGLTGGGGVVVPLSSGGGGAAGVVLFGPVAGARVRLTRSVALAVHADLTFHGVPVSESTSAAPVEHWFALPGLSAGLVFTL